MRHSRKRKLQQPTCHRQAVVCNNSHDLGLLTQQGRGHVCLHEQSMKHCLHSRSVMVTTSRCHSATRWLAGCRVL